MASTNTDMADEVLASSDEVLREQALRQLKKRRDFLSHGLAYVLVNMVVWAIWLVVGLSSHSWWPWPVFVTLGWGIGLALNAWDVYFRRPITEQELEREIERLQASR